jgi:hypothetical protein
LQKGKIWNAIGGLGVSGVGDALASPRSLEEGAHASETPSTLATPGWSPAAPPPLM